MMFLCSKPKSKFVFKKIGCIVCGGRGGLGSVLQSLICGHTSHKRGKNHGEVVERKTMNQYAFCTMYILVVGHMVICPKICNPNIISSMRVESKARCDPKNHKRIIIIRLSFIKLRVEMKALNQINLDEVVINLGNIDLAMRTYFLWSFAINTLMTNIHVVIALGPRLKIDDVVLLW